MYRVQMVSWGIGAYQNDFPDQAIAVDTAKSLTTKSMVEQSPIVELFEVARWANKRTVLRVFKLEEAAQ